MIKPDGSLISFMSDKVKAGGGINLAQGLPGFAPPTELLDILSGICHQNIHQYAPGNGNHNLLKELITHYSPYFPITKNNLMITNGATEAISLLFSYVHQKFAGDFTTLAFDPAYESFRNLPGIFRCPFIPFSYSNNFTIDFDTLSHCIKENNVRLVFINSPGNPLGKIWTKQEIDTILALSEELDFFIIFDAVYKDLYFKSPPHIPLNRISEKLFYVNSFSKLYSITGWRVGYLITHESHMKHLISIHDYTGLCTPSILQEALALYINKNGFINKYVESLRQQLIESYMDINVSLRECGFTPIETDGGYFIWTKLPDGYADGFKLAIDLYESENVAVIPGEHFSDNAKDYIRLNIARDKEEISEAIIRIKRFFFC